MPSCRKDRKRERDAGYKEGFVVSPATVWGFVDMFPNVWYFVSGAKRSVWARWVIGPRCLLWVFDVLSRPVACEFFESFGNLLDAAGSKRGISCGLVVEFRVVLGDYFSLCE